jgi:hypothetical protein
VPRKEVLLARESSTSKLKTLTTIKLAMLMMPMLRALSALNKATEGNLLLLLLERKLVLQARKACQLARNPPWAEDPT